MQGSDWLLQQQLLVGWEKESFVNLKYIVM
jgi:hypothetical protein